ncbi:hypothetical protein CTEN210_17617 [Chaetoceros tenuissimus]|uniref:HSF-type DNA-binding domain-containing protein n=1 Tax=Chaetoceros tenuissimus TaxID=426638 RepID=A0AAD3HF90_9STRA|nr:hypothetical protein CTEN210_17617 [Chaetoceros tenuissimus]
MMNKSNQSEEYNQQNLPILGAHRPPGLTAKGQKRMYVDHHYNDRSYEIYEPSSGKEREALSLYKQGQMTGPFPLKLQTLLNIVEKSNLDHIVSWQPHGRSFLIKDTNKFESILMKKFFNQGQLSSFRRQLNLYDFKRITRGPDAGSYYHEMFLRARPLLAFKMQRIKIKGTNDDIFMLPRNSSFLQQSMRNPIQEFQEARANVVARQSISSSGPPYPLANLFANEVNDLSRGALAATLGLSNDRSKQMFPSLNPPFPPNLGDVQRQSNIATSIGSLRTNIQLESLVNEAKLKNNQTKRNNLLSDSVSSRYQTSWEN